MSADNQKRDSQGRFKKKMFKAPDLSFPSAPKIAAPAEPKKENKLTKLLKPKKQIVIPEYNALEEAIKVEAGLTKPKGFFGKKKQEEARKAVEEKFGEIDWNPEAKFDEVTSQDLATESIQTLGVPTSESDLRKHSGKVGRLFKIKEATGEVVKVAESALLTFVEIEDSLSLDSDNPYRNVAHIMISIDEYEVRLNLNEVIFVPKV